MRLPQQRHRPSTKSVYSALFLLVSQLPRLHSFPTTALNFLKRDEGDFPQEDPSSPAFWWKLGVSLTLVALGGIFAGLTLALLSQDEITLQVLEASGDEKESLHAGKVLRLLKRGKHWVLCTLLLSNVVVNESLPIVFDSVLGGGWPAVVLSTALVVIFGEIIPQAVCVRYGLPIGARCSTFVLWLMYIMYPIAYPTALILDSLLGKDEGTTYKKAGLKTLVSLHRTLGTERLNDDEVTIITAVLDLKDKPVGDIMTPMKDVFVMSADHIMDVRTMNEILSKGYSRIPVHSPGKSDDFIGMLLVKTLITYDPEDEWPVSAFTLATLPETKPSTSALDILNYFQEGKSHMVLVSEDPGTDHGALGVVTLEDVIEELIGEEIVDETDVFVDVSRHLRRINPSAAFVHHSFHRISPKIGFNRAHSDSKASASEPSLANNRASAIPVVPLNKATEPKPSNTQKVLIKPGSEARNAQQAATVVTQEERLLGKKVAREHYGTINSPSRAPLTGKQVVDVENTQETIGAMGSGATLLEERITMGSNGTGGKVVISPVIPEDQDQRDGNDEHQSLI